MSTLGTLLQSQGKLEDAEQLMRMVLAGRREILPNSHTNVISSISNLASILYARGQLEEAKQLFRESIARSRQGVGDSHPDTLRNINNLVSVFRAQGKLHKHEPCCERRSLAIDAIWAVHIRLPLPISM